MVPQHKMSATYNRAAWIHEKGGALTVGPSEIVQPGPGEILVQNHAWGINPIDWKIQAFGVMLDKYPAIFGFDIAGEVVAFGEQVKNFKASFSCRGQLRIC